MNLQKKCLNCHTFFPAEPMEFEFYCEKENCQKSSFHRITRIKLSRHIPTYFFDIYDLDRPIIYNNKITSYEKVCRVCGKPLLKKDGTYSHHKRYCNEHTGYELWAKFNWGIVAKNYAFDVAAKNKSAISDKFQEYIKENPTYYEKYPQNIKRDLNHLTICELCQKLCSIYDYYWNRKSRINIINIHHKQPVHTLDKDNLHLIWDTSNLIALCEECHHKQDHQLKTKTDPFIHFKKITDFLEEV